MKVGNDSWTDVLGTTSPITVAGLSANTEYDVVVRGFFTLTGSPTVLPTLDSARHTVRTNS